MPFYSPRCSLLIVEHCHSPAAQCTAKERGKACYDHKRVQRRWNSQAEVHHQPQSTDHSTRYTQEDAQDLAIRQMDPAYIGAEVQKMQSMCNMQHMPIPCSHLDLLQLLCTEPTVSQRRMVKA